MPGKSIFILKYIKLIVTIFTPFSLGAKDLSWRVLYYICFCFICFSSFLIVVTVTHSKQYILLHLITHTPETDIQETLT